MKSPFTTRFEGEVLDNTSDPEIADRPAWRVLAVPEVHVAIAEVLAPAVVPVAPETVVEETKVFPAAEANFTLYEPGNKRPKE